jgi:pimeloyl-ACP methyl ester carboxylesterase
MHLSWPIEMRRVPGYRIYALDLPGHGMSGGEGYCSIPEYAAAVLEWMDQVNLRQVVAVGHSMGSAIAMILALRYAERVIGIGLLGSAVSLQVNPRLLGLAASVESYPQAVNQIIRWSFSGQAQSRLVELVRQRMLASPQEVLLADLTACNEFDLRGELRQIRHAALVLCGAEDIMTPVSCSEQLASSLPASKQVVIPESGHMVMLEQPQITAANLEHFLAGL